MYCQLGQDIYQLRQQNRDLLYELESNSVLLENRLKKLRDTTRTHRQSDKSWNELPPSRLKRKYESWRARGSSAHVGAARTVSNTSDQENLKPSSASRPAKRSKRNITIVSGMKKKNHHSQCHPQSGTSKTCPEKSTKKHRIVQKRKKPCPQCYCPDIYVETENKKGDSKVTGKVYIDTKGCETRTCSRCYGDHTKVGGLPTQRSSGGEVYQSRKGPVVLPSVSDICPIAESVHFTTPCDSPHPIKSIEDVCSVINYSPESVFLRRLKKRAELLQGNFLKDLTAEDNMSNTIGENQIKHTSDSDSENGAKLHTKSEIRQVPVHQLCLSRSKDDAKNSSSKEKSTSSGVGQVSVHSLCSCRSKGGITEASSSREKNLHTSSRKRQSPVLPLCSDQSRGGTRRATSARKQSQQTSWDPGSGCHCERKDRSPCHCFLADSSPQCNCKACRDRTIQKYLADDDVILGHTDTELDSCCPKAPGHKEWFNELKHFRHKNWCDCHAHDHSPKGNFDPDLATNLFELNEPQPKQKCLRRYVVNSKEIIIPGYAVHEKCTCHQDLSASARSMREASPSCKGVAIAQKHQLNRITLPSKCQPRESAPGSDKKEAVRKSSRSIVKGSGVKRQPSYLISRTSPITKYKLPVPTNSFALRYQKGVM